MDQSSRYTNLELQEEHLISGGNHVLTYYKMKPSPDHYSNPKSQKDYLAAAAHFAAESSTGTNVDVSTTDDFTKTVDAIVYAVNPEAEEMRIAYPIELFDRNITDGRAMIVSFLTLAIGNNQGMGDIAYAKMLDFYIPPKYLALFDGPSKGIADLWRVLGRPVVDGGFIVGTIIKPKLGLQAKPFADAAYDFWLGGDFIKNDEPQGNQVFAPMKATIPLVVDAMKRAQDKTGKAKLFSANITADDPFEIIARGEYILDAFGEFASHVAFLIDGYVGGPTAIATARRYFPNQFLHYHRAGHGAITSPSANRGYSAFVLSKMARLQGASGIHVGTMSYGKMEGDKSDKIIAFMIEQDRADGVVFRQDWLGMNPTTPIISGGMNALRVGGFFKNMGHSNVIMTAGGGSYGHIDGPVEGANSMRQAEQCWKQGADVFEFAKEHKAFARAFESFPKDADAIYPGWREKLGI
ncbi:MAG: ribulose-bisphosphate carboxylase [Deferribacteres bacterium]|nr:ribulose-bisphosphate carboxylase [candidate division KSB1 bacterium]MCB9503763.1 ribulose-bisphosphate carboxylase [Deferribacteres bacterium]